MAIKRESIFISTVRSFFNAFAGFVGILFGIIIIAMVIALIMGVLLKPQTVKNKTQLIISADAQGNRKLLSDSSPVILKLNIHGTIGSKDLNVKTFQSQLLDSREGLLTGDRVKGVLLHISSPGGLTFDSHQIYQLLMDYKAKYKVPVYAYVNGLCASGAYFIACSADKIYSPPVGLIGSVGAMCGPNFNFHDLMEKHGVKEFTITEGKDKDMLSPYREWGSKEAQSLKDIIANDYDIFVKVVSESRPSLSKTKLIDEYGAKVYSPMIAQRYGYIDDGNSSYNATLSALVKETEIEGDYQVVELKVHYPVLSGLIEGNSPLFTGKLKHELSLPLEFSSEFMNRSLYLFSPYLQ